MPAVGGREADDELVRLLAPPVAGIRPREIDEDGLARIPDGRMLGVDHAHVVRAPVRAAIQPASAAPTTSGSRCVRSAMPNLVAYIYTCMTVRCNVMTDLGPLGPLDELLAHQIVDTFATVSQSDRSWTEKICAMAGASDGSLSLGFGLGKYPNRGVMDAYAGVSRGTEQWTVRASRELGADGDTAAVGPMRYEVLEPMRRIRFALDANDAQPVSFEWVFEGVVPAVLENHEVHRARDGRRIDADIARYHHIGTAHGWVDVDGERSEFTDDTWVSTRDHSWGVRYHGRCSGRPTSRPRRFRRTSRRRSSGRRSS